MNGKTKIIWWLVGIVSAIILSYFNFVIASQARTDQRQDSAIAELTENVSQLTANIAVMLETFNKVNVIELNSDVKSMRGQVERIERKLSL